MRGVFKRVRIVMAVGALVWAGGCINLPPALERELSCPDRNAPDNFGSAAACAPGAR